MIETLLVLFALFCAFLSAFFLRLGWNAFTVSDGERELALMRISPGWRGVWDVLTGNVAARPDGQRDYCAHAGLTTQTLPSGLVVWRPCGQFSEEFVDAAHRKAG